MFARCMDRRELCDALRFEESKLDGLIEAGMPWHGDSEDPEFDETEVASWLVATGRAEIDPSKVATSSVPHGYRWLVERIRNHRSQGQQSSSDARSGGTR